MPDAEIARIFPQSGLSRGAEDAAGRQAWVVLGTHRSGTSAMARVLEVSGGRVPNDLLPASEANTLGYWESASVLALNDEMLATVDSGWDDAFAGRPRPYLSHFDRNFRRRAVDVVDAAFGAGGPIVLKDPRINVLAAFWDTALKEAGFRPYYLIMVRHPAEVAASLLARDKMPTDHGLMLWLDHMLAAERDTRGAPRVFVSYDSLLRDWRGVLDHVEEAWSLPLPRRTGVAGAEIMRFLRPGLRHHVASESALQGRPFVTDAASEVYNWFKAACTSHPPTTRDPLDRAAQWLKTLHEQLEPVLTYEKLRLAEVRTELSNYARHARALEEMREMLNEELARMRLVSDLRTDDLEQLRRVTSDQAEELDRLRAAAETSSAELEQARATTASHAAELQRLRAAADAQAVKFGQSRALAAVRTGELERVHTIAAAQADELQQLRDATVAQTGELEHLRAAADAQASELRQVRAESVNQASELERVHAVAAASADELERALAAADAQVAEVQRSRRAVDDKSNELARVRLAYELQISEVSAAASSHEAALHEAWREREAERNAHLGEVGHLQTQFTELLSELTLEKRERQAIDAVHDEAMKSLRESLEREAQERDTAPESFEEELQALQHQYRGLSDELRRVRASADAVLVQRRELEAELRTALQAAERRHAEEQQKAASRGAVDRRRESELEEACKEAAQIRLALEGAHRALSEEIKQRERAEAHAQASCGELEEVRLDRAAAEREIEALQSERDKVLASTIWRLTSMPRRMINGLRRS